jgi:DNA-directed RNA polymerase specialized sigma subunit
VFQNAEKELMDQKHRAPTDAELADHLSWPLQEVQLQRRSVRMDIPSSSIGGHQVIDMTDARHQQLLHDIYWELTPDEKKVFEHLFGMSGKKKAGTGKELSRLTGFSQPKVSVLRKSIAKKLEPHL